MRKIITLLFILSALIFTGCIGSLVKNAAKDTPIANKIEMHKWARTGDYAVYKSIPNTQGDQTAQALAGNTQVTLKVISAAGNTVTIRHETQTSMFGAGFMNNLVFQITADKKGNVLKGYMIDSDSNEKTPLKIAKQGDQNYKMFKNMNTAELRALNIPTRITVPAGTFKVYAKEATDTTNGTRTIYLYNPAVKFNQVATYVVYSNSETGKKEVKRVLELVQQGRQ